MSLGIFSVVPPTEPCALRSTQPLKVSTRDFSRGKVGRCVWLTTYHPCSAETSRKSGALIYPEPLGPLRSVAGHLYLYFSVFLKACKGNILFRISISRQFEKPKRCDDMFKTTAKHTGQSIMLLEEIITVYYENW